MENIQNTHIVQQEVQQTLPEQVIQYLWYLFDEARDSGGQTFVLGLCEFFDHTVQEIKHVWNGGRISQEHRVFGYSPVECEVCIEPGEEGYTMRLTACQ